MQERDFATLPRLGGERDRLPEVVEAALVAQLAAGQAAIAKGAGGLGEAELCGERERPLGIVDPGLVTALPRLGACELGERCDVVGARRQWLQQRHRLGGQLPCAWISEQAEHLPRMPIARAAPRRSSVVWNASIAASRASFASTGRPACNAASPKRANATALSGCPSGVSVSARSKLASAAAVSNPSARSPARPRKRSAGASNSAACVICPAAWASSSAVA